MRQAVVPAPGAPPTAPTRPAPASKSASDMAMRRLLCIPEGATKVREDQVHNIFSISIVLSGLRCLLSYVILPIITPLLGAAAGVGPAIGIPVGVVALVFDVKGIRRFWLADHPWRWAMTALYAVVMALVLGLVAADISHLLR